MDGAVVGVDDELAVEPVQIFVSADPNTGTMTKPAVPGRSITI